MKNASGSSEFFNADTFIANYAGDISLTPDGLHYLGMLPSPRRPHVMPFPALEPGLSEPVKRAS